MAKIESCLTIVLFSCLFATAYGILPIESICSVNETFAESGFDCQTCFTITLNCDKKTEDPKCYCNGGYIRETEGGNCVLYEECVKVHEPRCKVNETFGLYFNCQSCSNYPLVRCGVVPEPQCVCFPGYVHNDVTGKGECIATRDCPNKFNFPSPCPENETYAQSGYDCLSCQNVAAGLLKKCAENKAEKCYCNSGYIRDTETGLCRLYDECKKVNTIAA